MVALHSELGLYQILEFSCPVTILSLIWWATPRQDNDLIWWQNTSHDNFFLTACATGRKNQMNWCVARKGCWLLTHPAVLGPITIEGWMFQSGWYGWLHTAHNWEKPNSTTTVFKAKLNPVCVVEFKSVQNVEEVWVYGKNLKRPKR